MDLDLALVRSFVVTAQEGHVRRASAQLFVTQQALSKRIRRLEAALGVALFDRTAHGVELTEPGRRFLPHAMAALSAGESAVAAVRPSPRQPLRADVVDDRLAPLRLLRRLLDTDPELPVQVTMRQGLSSALPALVRDEIDIAFGRVHDLTCAWPSGLDRRLVRLEPLRALVTREHPLADRPSVRLPELAATGVWMPDFGRGVEWEGYVRGMAGEFGIPLTITGPAVGETHFVALLWEHHDRPALGGMDVSYAYSTDIRVLPIVDPTPVFPWWLVWPRDRRHPLLDRLLAIAAEQAPSWLAYHPDRHWLPAADRAELPPT